MEELIDAVNAAIDARLKEHGLLEDEKPKGKKGKDKDEKPKGKKGKDKDDDDDEVTADSLKEKFVELVNDKGSAEAKKVLKKLKVSKLGELDEDDYEKAMKLIKEELGESTDDDDLIGD